MSRGRRTQIGGASDAVGFLAVPSTGSGPGVLVLPPEPGLPAVVGDACERLAREGFVALAPDAVASEPGAPGLARARPVVDAALEALLRENATVGARVGVLGLGRGAVLALDAATRSPRIAAVALLGGAPESGSDVPLDALDAPVVAVLGEKDEAVASGRAHALESRLRDVGARCALRVQPGADGAFFDERRADVHDAAATTAAWDAVLAALRAELA